MTRKLFTLLCVLCGSATALPLFSETRVPKDKEDFALFLLVGQSNMAGRGKLTPQDRQPTPGVLVFNKEDKWAYQGEPIHFDKPKIDGVGLGFTFGKLVAQHNPKVTVGLIPCAVGGTPISRWKPGGDLFEEAVRRARLAQQSGTLKGILWHQGEAACGRKERAQKYSKELTEVMEGFRKALNAPDVPVVAGELGEYLYTRLNKKGKRASPYAEVVNEQIRSLPGQLPHSAVALSHGLTPKSDNLHFTAQSQKTFGKRYFEAYQSLVTPKP